MVRTPGACSRCIFATTSREVRAAADIPWSKLNMRRSIRPFRASNSHSFSTSTRHFNAHPQHVQRTGHSAARAAGYSSGSGLTTCLQIACKCSHQPSNGDWNEFACCIAVSHCSSLCMQQFTSSSLVASLQKHASHSCSTRAGCPFL